MPSNPTSILYPRTFSGLPAVQLRKEFSPLLSRVKELAPRSYLEIGTARGDSFHEIVSHMPPGSRAVAVDMPQQQWGLKDSGRMLRAAVTDLNKKGYDCYVIWGDSTSPEVVGRVRAFAPYDLVFIDGDHSYEGVKADFENYGRLGRTVVFHDTADPGRPNKRGETIQVSKFWEEVKTLHPHEDFVDGEAPAPMGIGVLYRERSW